MTSHQIRCRGLEMLYVKLAIYKNVHMLFIIKALTTFITKTRLFQYTKNFYHQKIKKLDKKKSDIFHISAQNIDCGYSIEPPRRGNSNEYHHLCFLAEIRKIMYTPVNETVNPSFTT